MKYLKKTQVHKNMDNECFASERNSPHFVQLLRKTLWGKELMKN